MLDNAITFEAEEDHEAREAIALKLFKYKKDKYHQIYAYLGVHYISVQDRKTVNGKQITFTASESFAALPNN